MKRILCVALCAATACMAATACVGQNQPGPTPTPPPAQTEEQRQDYDLFIFMGQSNMGGRGIQYSEAVPVGAGHAYEYRAVTGNDQNGWLYQVQEPFGKDENNQQLSDGNKKSGGMVSAFCEAYYQSAQVPVIAVSASVGGTSINLWTPGTDYFNEAKRRLTNAIQYTCGLEDGQVRHVNMVWCQGESDASAFAAGKMDYSGKLNSIVQGLKNLYNGLGVEHCFIVPPSEYGDGQLSEAKTALAEEQIKLCSQNPDFVLASLKFRNVPKVLRDDPHFFQGVYNVCGWDAGTHAATFIADGTQPQCTPFTEGEELELAQKFGITLSRHT